MRQDPKISAQENGENCAFAVPATAENIFVPGLTKLEHFAGMAMQGILANPNRGNNTTTSLTEPAKEAVLHAKYLLQELQTQGEK